MNPFKSPSSVELYSRNRNENDFQCRVSSILTLSSNRPHNYLSRQAPPGNRITIAQITLFMPLSTNRKFLLVPCTIVMETVFIPARIFRNNHPARIISTTRAARYWYRIWCKAGRVSYRAGSMSYRAGRVSYRAGKAQTVPDNLFNASHLRFRRFRLPFLRSRLPLRRSQFPLGFSTGLKLDLASESSQTSALLLLARPELCSASKARAWRHRRLATPLILSNSRSNSCP